MKFEIVIVIVILFNFGEVSSWLDNIKPEQFISLEDNDDGSFTAEWDDGDDRSQE